MQIASIWDNLHELSNSVIWENKKKKHILIVCWISPESGKGIIFHMKYMSLIIPKESFNNISTLSKGGATVLRSRH